MAKIEDRIRDFWPGGRPMATGVLAVGDARACTNPSVRRGASIGMLHATVFATRSGWGRRPRRVGRGVRRRDHGEGRAVVPRHPGLRPGPAGRDGGLGRGRHGGGGAGEYGTIKALQASMMKDRECLRAFLDVAMVLKFRPRS